MVKWSGVRICFPISPPFGLFQSFEGEGQLDLVHFKAVSGLFRLLCKGFKGGGVLKIFGNVVHWFPLSFLVSVFRSTKGHGQGGRGGGVHGAFKKGHGAFKGVG